MRKFYSAIMALSVLLFASCDKNEGDIGTTGDGVQAKMGLTISFPLTTTKAADDNATQKETTVNSVTVFIYEADGSHAEGSPKTFSGTSNPTFATAFDPGTGTNVNEYSLNDEYAIETTAGEKKIYVGVNLPAALTSVNEYGLKAATSVVGLVDDDGYISMLSPVIEATLEASEDVNDIPAANKVDAGLERLVSKIAVRNSSTYPNTTRGGGSFTLKPDAFTVGNVADMFYPVQRKDNGFLVTPGLTTSPTAPVLENDGTLREGINDTSIPSNVLAYYNYVYEHSPDNNRWDATYAVVRAKFEFESFAYVDEDNIKLKSSDNYATITGETGKMKLWVVQTGDYTYFCESLEDAVDVQDLLQSANDPLEYHRASDGKFYTFYYVYINNDKYNDDGDEVFANNERLAIYRNQFYDITIKGASGMGVPGDNDDSDPEEDPDPDEDNPENPPIKPPVTDPDDPDPVYEDTALLQIDISVSPWQYINPDVILEPLK